MADRSPSPTRWLDEVQGAEAVVKVNAGGKEFQTTPGTLQRIDFVHARWNFEHQTRADASNDANEEAVFLDVDPEVFAVVLELARGAGLVYLQEFPQKLQTRVRQQMRDWHMDHVLGVGGFRFDLVKSKFLSVKEGRDTPGRKICVSAGRNDNWGTVLGDQAVPEIGDSYFEVEVLKLGTVFSDFGIGVVEHSAHQRCAFWMAANASILATGMKYTSQSIYRATSRPEHDGNKLSDCSSLMPRPAVGTKLGVYIDMDVGQLSFYADGKLCIIARDVDIAGKTLFPALSVRADTVLKVHSGLNPPITEDSFMI